VHSRPRWRIAGPALLLLALGTPLAGCGRPGEPQPGSLQQLAALARADASPTSLLVILVDTLRADRLSGYGYSRPTSPFLDQLASGGVSFRRVLSPSSWTKPAMASILTASYPARHGVLRANDALPETARLPAEVFGDAGYRTAAVVGNHWLSQRFGFEQGFQVYQRFTRDFVLRRQRRDPESTTSGHWADRDITESAIEFLRGVGEAPFFLYLHYMGVHNHASDPAPPHFGSEPDARYDNAVAEADRQVANVVGALEELGLRSRTLVVVTSDHGESLSERGFDGHGFSLYAQEVEVPLLISPPFPLERPREVKIPVSSIDLFPTLYEILGVGPPPGLVGRSLLPIILSGPDAAGGPVPVFSHLDRRWSDLAREADPIASVLLGRHYYIRDLKDPNRAELFDVFSDPAQLESLARSAGPDIANPLRRQLRRYDATAQQASGSAVQVELPAEILKELEQLGYVIRE